MTTTADLIDRAFRDYLTPPGEQPTRFKVDTGGIDDSSTTLPVDVTMLGPEQQDAIGVGTLIEGETGELFLIEAVTGDPPSSLTVRREMYETTAQALAAGKYLFLAGDDHKARKSVFDGVADAVSALWPDLYDIDVWETVAEAGPTEIPEDAVTVTNVEYRDGARWLPARGWKELRKHPYVSTDRAIQLGHRYAGCDILVHFRRKPVRPTAETDTLEDLLVDEAWSKVVVVGAVAQVAANQDLDRATIDFITEALEAQGVEISGADIRNSLLQYQSFLKAPLMADLASQEDDRVVYVR